MKVLWSSTNEIENSLTENARIIELNGERILEVYCQPKKIIERLKGCLEILTGRGFVFSTVMTGKLDIKGE